MATKPAPVQWTTGTKMTAANLNAGDYDVWNFLDRAKPVCQVYTGVAQSMATGTWVPLTFESEWFDTDNQHDPVTNNGRINIGNTLGVYRIGGVVVYNSTVTTGTRRAMVRMNGSGANSTGILDGSYVSVAPASTGWTTVWLPNLYIRSTQSTDYIEVVCWHDAGATQSLVSTTGIKTNFYAEYVGALQ